MQSFIRIIILTVAGLVPITLLQAQGTSATSATDKSASGSGAKRTDVYHVLFGYAAPGKSAELLEFLKTPDPNSPNPSHFIILRHQEGDAWDYVVIDHLGTKATVEISAPMPSSARGLMQKHDDTFVSGPPWAEFTKQLGIDGDAAKTAGSVYVVSVYRAAPGQFDALQKMLSEAPNRTVDTSAGNVLMQHLEGGAWNFLAIARYDSWQKYAANEINSIAQTNKKEGGWFDLRQHISFHTDTLTDRVAP